jgi:hypothetical protein
MRFGRCHGCGLGSQLTKKKRLRVLAEKESIAMGVGVNVVLYSRGIMKNR